MENVKQNTMKYKILFIFSFILLTLLLFNTNVFASDVTSEYSYSTFKNSYDIDNNIDEELYSFLNEQNINTINKYVLAFFGGYNSSYFYIYITDFPVKVDVGVSSSFYVSGNIDFYTFSASSISLNSFVFDDYRRHTSIGTVTLIYAYANFDVCDYNTGEVVFQRPVQEIALAQVLVEEKTEQPAMVLKEVILILPLIIVIVVSFLGLRKALQMLSTLLNRA